MTKPGEAEQAAPEVDAIDGEDTTGWVIFCEDSWFAAEDLEQPRHREIALEMEKLAGPLAQLIPDRQQVMVQEFDDLLVIAIDVDAPVGRRILRTLRADFRADSVMLGQDETGQLVTTLDPSARDVQVVSATAPRHLAGAAVSWFEQELEGP